jgi:mono/diheme cytochrome c family protein
MKASPRSPPPQPATPPATLESHGAPMPRCLWPIAFLVAALLAPGSRPALAADEASTAPTPEQVRFFEAQVRPVLLEHCAGCHGAKKVKAGLRLDSRAAILGGGDSGPAVVPGKPEESPLIAAIHYVEDPKMPPKGKLPQRQVEALTQWVKMGAPWPGGGSEPVAGGAEPASTIRKPGYRVTDADRAHWAFRPLVRPAPPTPAGHPVDAFIRAGLDARGLKPTPPASRVELIRRVTYDLTGLPPSPEEVDAFQADPAPDAYEKLVDRLLASPRYGERWGRHWLDLVRFAETNSYERDGAKPNAWRYRDYVIRSFNQDKPYDRFIQEQLAGDELADAGPDGLIATGYYRLGLWDDEPADREQSRYDGLDDIVATTGQVFLGLTVDCARCHDHKLDPIPQKDYYRFLSFFQNLNTYRNGGPTDEVALFADESARRAFEHADRALKQRRNQVQAALSAVEAEFREAYERTRGGKALARDLDDLTYRFYRDSWETLPDFDALQPEEAGKLPDGLFSLAPRSRDESFGFVFEGTLIVPKDGPYTFQLDSDDGSRLIIDGRKVVERDGVHRGGDDQGVRVDLTEGRVPIRLDYFQRSAGLGLTVSWSGPGFANRPLSAARSKDPASPGRTPLPAADFARLIRREGAGLLGEAKVGRFRELSRELDDLKKAKAPADRALVVTEAGAVSPPTHVLIRGNPHSPGEEVGPAFVQVVSSSDPAIPPPPPGAKSTGRRLALANWIASAENPLTARVMANRVWQYHFGRGIVRSSSNLGTQGDRPTHPELLDWLASELVAGGWKLKPLHRLILTSDAYRRSSRADPASLATDPTNDRLWRFDSRRLSAEEVRDSILAVAGDLSLTMYGPGVYPEIPAEVLAGQSVPGAGWGKSSPEDQARRSVYVHLKRSLVLPILESFDMAETDRSAPTRFATTQPTQALGMLNGSFLNREAAVLAARLRREAGPGVGPEVERAFRLATGREPSEAEVRRGVDLIAALRDRDGSSPEEALAAFCLLVLNLNEFLYLD